jgi:hypothetical protein
MYLMVKGFTDFISSLLFNSKFTKAAEGWTSRCSTAGRVEKLLSVAKLPNWL